MSRPKSTGKDLPPNMIVRRRKRRDGTYWEGYYYNGRDDEGRRVETPLGTDKREALRKWAELHGEKVPTQAGTMAVIFDRYERDVIPWKSAKSQAGNLAELEMLRKAFADAPIDAIKPMHIAQYRDARRNLRTGELAPVRANREIALLSHIFNMAREWGYTERENPCAGVRRNREKPRDYYATDAVYFAVYEAAEQALKDAMDLAYYTGQRPADVMQYRWSDIHDGALWVKQDKTGAKLRVEISGDLERLLQAIRSRPMVSATTIICTAHGRPLRKENRQRMFVAARADAAAKYPELADAIMAFQYRDIRPKAASETNLDHAQKLLGHANPEITKRVYRRAGERVSPLKKR